MQRYKSSHSDIYSNKLGGGHEAGCRQGPTVCDLDLFSIIYNMEKKHKKINIEMKLPCGRWLRMPGLCTVGICPCHLLKKLKLALRSQRNKTENSLVSLNKNIHILNCDNEISVTQSHGVCSHPSRPPPSRQVPCAGAPGGTGSPVHPGAKRMESPGPGRPPQARGGQQATVSGWPSAHHCSPPWRALIHCDPAPPQKG